jgi:hypothetical protein
MGRWRLDERTGTPGWTAGVVEVSGPEGGYGTGGRSGDGRWHLTQHHGIRPFASDDPDSERVWWSDAGVHQNLTFPVQPDPVSGMHCWLQRVTVSAAGADDAYGDIAVDTGKSMEIFREWLAKTRPGPGPGGLRRPLHFARPVKPTASAYVASAGSAGSSTR